MRSPARPSVTGGDTPFMEWKASLAGHLQPLKRDFDPHPPGSREAARAKRLWSTPTPGGLVSILAGKKEARRAVPTTPLTGAVCPSSPCPASSGAAWARMVWAAAEKRRPFMRWASRPRFGGRRGRRPEPELERHQAARRRAQIAFASTPASSAARRCRDERILLEFVAAELEATHGPLRDVVDVLVGASRSTSAYPQKLLQDVLARAKLAQRWLRGRRKPNARRRDPVVDAPERASHRPSCPGRAACRPAAEAAHARHPTEAPLYPHPRTSPPGRRSSKAARARVPSAVEELHERRPVVEAVRFRPLQVGPRRA